MKIIHMLIILFTSLGFSYIGNKILGFSGYSMAWGAITVFIVVFEFYIFDGIRKNGDMQ
jgi:hypothetical protein